jgi:mannose-6-phosphate isomerase
MFDKNFYSIKMKEDNSLYPLKFQPILKEKIWGGTRLKKLFNKQTESDKIGESWELSGFEGDESIVSNGFLAGNNLTELIEIYMGDLVGDKIFEEFGLTFPLLFKLIDANDDLSIQVHPDDETAAQRHNSLGKTEMWYVIDAEPGGELIVGFKNDCSREEYLKALEEGRVADLLKKVPVSKNDVIYIPAGLVHAIKKGVLVAEIQETSDLTYRIFDYKRTDEHGKERELHTELALDVINFSATKNPKVEYEPKVNAVTTLVSCDYFTTNLLIFNRNIIRNYSSLDSFVVYMCLEGNFILECENHKILVEKGETVLIPASLDEVSLIPQGEVKLLEVYIQ